MEDGIVDHGLVDLGGLLEGAAAAIRSLGSQLLQGDGRPELLLQEDLVVAQHLGNLGACGAPAADRRQDQQASGHALVDEFGADASDAEWLVAIGKVDAAGARRRHILGPGHGDGTDLSRQPSDELAAHGLFGDEDGEPAAGLEAHSPHQDEGIHKLCLSANRPKRRRGVGERRGKARQVLVTWLA